MFVLMRLFNPFIHTKFGKCHKERFLFSLEFSKERSPTKDHAVAEQELVVLQGEGGEEVGEAGDEAAEDGGETDGLPPAVGDGEGGEEEGGGEGEAAQDPYSYIQVSRRKLTIFKLKTLLQMSRF